MPNPSMISLRHFILFGLMHGFVRRIHEYPIIVLTNNYETSVRKDMFYIQPNFGIIASAILRSAPNFPGPFYQSPVKTSVDCFIGNLPEHHLAAANIPIH